MNTHLFPLLAILALIAHADEGLAADKYFAFRVIDLHPTRYISAVPNGGLNALGDKISEGQIFTLADTNSGDLVQIKWVREDGSYASFWQETEESVRRVAKGDSESTFFTVKKSIDGVSIQTASGKYLLVDDPKSSLRLTDDEKNATVFELIENPGNKKTP